MSMECQVNVKSQSELDIGGRETCSCYRWLRSSTALSLPGLLFSVLFTLPNYFQLRTVIVRDKFIALEENDPINKVDKCFFKLWFTDVELFSENFYEFEYE